MGISVILYAGASLVARQFNPTQFLSGPDEKAAHDEIIAYLTYRHRT